MAAQLIRHPEFDRLYRTGDLARWLPDGTVDFLGRLDNQIKLHGRRIDLEEIEAQLMQLPQVAEAACGGRERTAGGHWLVGGVAAPTGGQTHPIGARAAMPRQRRGLPAPP